MRQKRTKIYRKLMHQFQLHFGFREPYQMLIDETFAQSLVRLKTQNPSQQFANVLCGKVKPMITQCCMVALYKLGKEHQPTVNLAKEWERRKCNHREAIEPHECIKSVVGEANKHRYVLASDNQPLRAKLRNNVPGLPMVHFTQAVMVLEPMSNLSRSKVEQIEDVKLSGHAPPSDPSATPATNIIGADTTSPGESSEPPQKKRKGPKAPNPLSVKKAKREKLTPEEKLAREQELKKQKQKEKAAERLRAQREAEQAKGDQGGDGASPNANAQQASIGAKRKRNDAGEEGKGSKSDVAVAGKGTDAAADAGDKAKPANRRRRQKSKAATAVGAEAVEAH
ncbi:uncharacterized protein PFL1_04091 [Pseudozyma flocculosa PF-1]|uniref:U three protein 23 n=2 Tax=Pseudozyma flocculosa TaxID=84751 RepID=A0A5C3ESS9_9BASI|nr:uncharacterized protein PFL1_04091 [Pseudozyma flocculosa PF-1]EPQ28264.1 hypothetical protein PFL1_04091 [Pseudozyma flocculosa PF-1]SPO35404.1 related to UTP23 - essential nucleolar protein that is a component of the SSU processome [Pseudozyma flocculosa]